MSKLESLKKNKTAKSLIKPVDILPNEETTTLPEKTSREETTEVENYSSTNKRTKRKKNEDSLITEYNGQQEIEEFIKKGYIITKLQYKKINVLSELFTRRTGNKINVSEIVRNALDQYLDKTYNEFIKNAPPNPFDL